MRPSALALALLLLSACDFDALRCHVGYNYVHFVAEHEESYLDYDYSCGPNWDMEYECGYVWVTKWKTVPDHCETQWICLQRCGDVDRGKLEKHTKHETVVQKAVRDPQCEGV